MITFLFGSYGSGKSTAILESISKDVEAGIHTFLLVPEQETVQAEYATLSALPPSAQLKLEVLNFSRLYNRACREFGGLSYRYITKPIRHLLMWQNLKELAPLLEIYGPLCEKDSSLGEIMLSALDECRACGISPDQLERTASQFSSDDPLGKRLRDLALIFASFDRLVSQNYSDSSCDLARLYELLTKERFFRGCHVYLDSFTSFTAMEHRIIERIFAQADHVTVAIPMSGPDCNDISTAGIRESMKSLIRSAEQHGGYKTVILRGNKRAHSPSLAHLSDALWRMDLSGGEGQVYHDGSIRLEICDTPYAEAEATALHILDLLRKGERCRDILVLMRNPDQYRGILEPALDKNAIPFFFSEKTDLCSLPPLKLLLSALRIKQYHWQKNDVISHLKTGMYAFDSRDLDLFEEYVSTWNIRGSRFTDSDWTMNPDGFTEFVSERGKSILLAANTVRRRLVEILEKFFILLDASENVPDMCRAVYTYFVDIELEDRLNDLAAKELEYGNRKEAAELQSLFGVLLNTLADIAAAMPQEAASTEEFYHILRIVFRQSDIGTIPTSVDEVTVGSAAMLRGSNPKYVFVLGLCEGVFPAATNDTGLFTSVERATLADLGITLSADCDTRSADELMFVHRAFSAPSHGLFLLTSLADSAGSARNPSLPFNRVRELFANLEPHRFCGNDIRYLVGTPRCAAAHLRTIADPEDAGALKDAISLFLPETGKLSALSSSMPDCSLSQELASSLVGKSVRFSSTRFERYVECPFQYYCTYVLGLREKKRGDFRASNIGTFIHYILEQLLRFAVEPGEDGTLPTDEELVERTEETVSAYIEKICPDEWKSSHRLRHLYTRLKRLSLLMIRNLVEEFSQSEFQPMFFELNTNGQENNPLPMEFVLQDGFRVSFSGIIDRVDVLKKDGEVYIRIVDYKTGTKIFSLEDVKHGINIQMLLYLFTLCRNSDSPFCRSLGLADGKTPTPAGVVYLSANVPVVSVEDYDGEEAVLKKASASLKRSGLLLAEEDILKAMNASLSPTFLAGIKKNKDGVLVGDALTDRESFNKLYEQIRSTVESITEELRGGVADARPLQYHQSKDPCAYCQMKPICRRNEE